MILCFLTVPGVFAQVTVPDGTKLRVRLDQAISSATADEGQVVELSVAEAVKIGDTVVFPEGSRGHGNGYACAGQTAARLLLQRAWRLVAALITVRA